MRYDDCDFACVIEISQCAQLLEDRLSVFAQKQIGGQTRSVFEFGDRVAVPYNIAHEEQFSPARQSHEHDLATGRMPSCLLENDAGSDGHRSVIAKRFEPFEKPGWQFCVRLSWGRKLFLGEPESVGEGKGTGMSGDAAEMIQMLVGQDDLGGTVHRDKEVFPCRVEIGSA